MRVDGAFWTGKGQCRFGAASSRFWDEEAVREGEKGLQDKGSASLSHLSYCLHIFFLRDMVSLEGGRSLTNDGNPPFLCKNREQRPQSPTYGADVTVRLLVDALRP